jgi:glutathione S-transferase
MQPEGLAGNWYALIVSSEPAQRWLESGMVAYEKASKAVLGKGQPDPVFIKRGEEIFSRFAGVLDTWLRGRKWLLGDDLPIADFSIGALVPQSTRAAAHRSIWPPTGRPHKS